MEQPIQKNISFLSLWSSQFLYQLGDALYILAIITLLYTLTHSALLTSLFPLIRSITLLCSGSIAPMVMKRWPLRAVLIWTQLFQVILLLGITLYLEYGHLHLSWLSLLLLLIAGLEGWTAPTRNAMLPRIVGKEQLVKANGLVGTSSQIAFLVGFSLGGVVVSIVGTTHSLWISLGLWMVASLLLWKIQDHTPRKEAKQSGKTKEIWSFIYTHPIYRKLFILDAIEFMAGAVWTGAITLVFVKEILHKNEAWWGFFNGSYLLETTLGGFLRSPSIAN